MEFAKIIKIRKELFENSLPPKSPSGMPELKVKEGFPVPSPEGAEDEKAFISRCMHEIGNEYEQSQALAICYSKWEKG